ncbi:MAG: hypothetical protein GWP15_04260 [Nitrospirae bacterium]|nr:hypothetical protein [Nitrospirota bacterium]
MKNRKIRNSLIAAGIAVLAGVLVLSVSVAIGDAPGYAPPGGGVSPVFSGLGVTGDSQFLGSTATYGNFIASGSTNRFDGDLEVDGTLEVLEPLVVSGFYGIRTATPTDPDPVKIDDDLDVVGDLQLGTGSMFGSIYNVNSSTSGTWVFSDSCYSDDILLSCGGYSSAGLRGLYPFATVCMVYPASSAPTVTAYLTCLDPEGIRTGFNP